MQKTMIRLAALAALGLAGIPPAGAQTAAPSASMTKPAADTKSTGGKKEPTPAQLAARERQKTCSMEWQAAKKEKKLAPGTRWPGFWHECNARLKAKGA